MDSIIIEKESWTAEVINYNTSSNNLPKIKTLTYKYTDLFPFLDINSVIDELNSSLYNFKKYTTSQSANMIKVAENKEKDDKAGAKSFTPRIQ